MRRFHWRLQQVLDVKVQQEHVLRSALMSLMEQIAMRRQDMVMRKAELRSMLSDLAGASIDERMLMQETVMRSAARAEAQVLALNQEVARLTADRTEKTAQLIKLRKSQERLENMREEARREHVYEQLRAEQKEFDENAQIAFAREAASQRPPDEAGV